MELSLRYLLAARAFLIAAVLTTLLVYSPLFRSVELPIFDLQQKLLHEGMHKSTLLDDRIRLVALDHSTQALGWTSNRTLDLLWKLEHAGVGATLVLGSGVFDGKEPEREFLPDTARLLSDQEPELLLAAAANPTLFDEDGVLRSFPADHPALRVVGGLAGPLGVKLPTGSRRLFVSFHGLRDNAAQTINAEYLEATPLQELEKALADPDQAAAWRGAVVLVSLATPNAATRQVTTRAGAVEPSVVYAHTLDTLLKGWTYRPLGRAAGLWLTFLVMALFVMSMSGRKPLVLVTSGVGAMLLLSALSMVLMARGFEVPLAKLVVGLSLSMLILLFLELQRVRRSLGSFGGVEDAHLSGTEAYATILFTELPQALLELERRQSADVLVRRRDYNTIVAQIVGKYHGQVLDYQGDAQMIGFGLRHQDDMDHALEATAAALEIVARVPLLAESWKVPPEQLQVHAGVCTGSVALGHVGAMQKQDIAAIGDTTNTAARLMGAAMKLGRPVVVSESTHEAARGLLEARRLEAVELKGKSEKVEIFEALAVDDDWRAINLKVKKDTVPSGGTIAYRGGKGRADLAVTLVLGLLAYALMLALNRNNPTKQLEWSAYDALHATFLAHSSDARIVLVGIDEETCLPEHLGPYPWSRAVHARLLENLKPTGYAGIFFDIAFKQPSAKDPEGDAAFAAMLDSETRATVGAALEGRGLRYDDPLFFAGPELRERLRQRHQMGLIHKREDEDRVLRWAVLAAESSDADNNDVKRLYPTGALSLLLQPEGKLELTERGLLAARRLIPSTVHSALPNELLVRFGPPTTATGREPAPGSYRYVSLWHLLDSGDPILQQLKGAYLFVGDTFSQGEREELDRVHTPVGYLKGVEVHARTLDTLLNESYIQRPAEWKINLWVLFLCAAALWILARHRDWQSYIPRLVGLAALQAATYFVLLVRFSVWIDLFYPLLSIVAVCCAVGAGRYLLTLRALSRFVPSEVADEILFHHRARDRRVVATVLLTDIRGYTTLSEGRSAVAMLDILNEYHRRTVACYQKYGGQALTYQGDAQIVVFGVFGRRPNPARDAVAAALELQGICKTLRREWGIEKREDFDVGAGLCTGEVQVGLLGGRSNLQYSVVGETVRKSHKVQSMSTELEADVLLDEETFLATGGTVQCDDLGAVAVKGVEGAVRLYRARAATPEKEGFS